MTVRNSCGQASTLPIFPELTDDEVDYVCDQVEAFYR